jgi:hypothetical protein
VARFGQPRTRPTTVALVLFRVRLVEDRLLKTIKALLLVPTKHYGADYRYSKLNVEQIRCLIQV